MGVVSQAEALVMKTAPEFRCLGDYKEESEAFKDSLFHLLTDTGVTQSATGRISTLLTIAHLALLIVLPSLGCIGREFKTTPESP